MGATNRIDVLDPALLRPGRISRKVVVPLPDVEGRQQIMRVHLKDVPMASDQEKSDACTRIAMLTQNFSGAPGSQAACTRCCLVWVLAGFELGVFF